MEPQLHSKARPLLAIFLLFTLPILIGAAISPYVFNFLRELGESTDAYDKLTKARFERVTSRCVMITAALILYPIVRLTGLWPQVKRGLTRSPDRWRDLRISMLIGSASMAAVFFAGWHLNAFISEPKIAGNQHAFRILGFICGATFIGVFEEIFFRGFVYGALRTRLGFFAAMVVSSIVFSGIHFFRPLYPETIDTAIWSSGYALIPHMFDRFVWEKDALYALTLFVMGLTLATFYEKRGNLYFIIGLHASWVFAMQTGAYFLKRKHDVMPVLFGSSDYGSKGVLALIAVSLFYLAALAARPSITGDLSSNAKADDHKGNQA